MACLDILQIVSSSAAHAETISHKKGVLLLSMFRNVSLFLGSFYFGFSYRCFSMRIVVIFYSFSCVSRSDVSSKRGEALKDSRDADKGL